MVKGLALPNEVGMTVPYCAPEYLVQIQSGKPILCTDLHRKADVYSYAIMICELMSKSCPWDLPNALAIREAVISGKRTAVRFHPIYGTGSKKQGDLNRLKQIVELAWVQDAALRPSMERIIELLEAK